MGRSKVLVRVRTAAVLALAALVCHPVALFAQATPPPAPPDQSAPPAPAPLPAPKVDAAYAAGYNDGYTSAQNDQQNTVAANAHKFRLYQDADDGYAPQYGTREAYHTAFRSGFDEGYGDGYAGRPATVAPPTQPMGVVPAPAPPATAANMLPASPDEAMKLPPGVYANGVLLAQNTYLHATLDQEISSKTAHPGDPFTMTVSIPVWVGTVQAIPAGSIIHGTVKQAEDAGKMSGSSKLQLGYESVELPGRPPLAFEASTTGLGAGNQSVNGNEGTASGQSNNGTQRVATDAGMGAVLGGIFGGYGGLVRGALAGTIIGGAGVMMAKNKSLVLKNGEPVTLRLDQPLELITPPTADPQS